MNHKCHAAGTCGAACMDPSFRWGDGGGVAVVVFAVIAPLAGLVCWLIPRVGLFAECFQRHWRGCFPAFLAVFDHDIGENAAAYIPLGGEPHESGLGGGDEVVEDFVGDGFVEGAFVTVGPHVELEAFELYAFVVGDVVEGEGGEIGLAGFGAQAGEFRDLHVDVEITMRGRIGESLERLGGLRDGEGRGAGGEFF